MNESIFLIIQEMTAVLSIEQLQALQKSLIKNLVDEKPKTEQELSDEDYINRYITAKGLEGKTKGTLYSYRNTINRVLKYCDAPIPGITTDMLRYAIEQLQKETDCGNCTLDTKRRHLSSFFTWLVDEEYIIRNPMSRIHKIKFTKKVKKVYSDEDIEILREHCRDIRELAIVDILNSTGMRVGEMFLLNKSDVNIAEKECTVHGKGDKERIVYFDAKAKYHLLQYLESRTDDNPALFVGLKKPHKRLTAHRIEYIIRELGKRADVGRCHPHKFRATTATRAIDHGMPIEQVKEMLGHSQIDTTLIYAQVSQKNIKISHEKYLC